MDFKTLLPGILETIETVMLLVTLFFMTGVIREKKKNAATDKASLIKALLCLFIFLAIKAVRIYFL